MRLEFTPAVERALELAQQCAGKAGVPPTIKRLFLALIEEEESKAAGVLIRAGMPVAEARASIHALPITDVASPTLATLLGRAREMALELGGERTVDSEHVMLALLRCQVIQT